MININTQIKFKGLNRNIINTLYIIGTVLLSIRSVIGLSQLNSPVFSFLTYIAYTFVLVRILLYGASIRNWIVFVLLLALGFLIYERSANTIVINTVFFIFGAIGIDKEKIMRWNAVTLIISTTGIILMSIIGVITIYVDNYLTFGFNNPNGLQAYLVAFTILWICGSYNNMGKVEISIWILINVTSSIILDSRTSYFVMLIVFLLATNSKKTGKKNFIGTEYFYLSLVFITAFCVVTCNILYPIKVINDWTSGRFSQAASYLVKYGIAPFGSHIVELDVGYKFYHLLLDCGYARLFINYGWVYGIIYVIAHFWAIRIARINNNNNMIIALMGFAVLMIMENGGTGVNFNMSLLLLSDLFLVGMKGNNIERIIVCY